MLKVACLVAVARQLRDNIMNENRKGVKARHKRKVASIEPSKPRNFVAKNAGATTSGAGAHKDKKKAMKQGETKHKKQEYAESYEQQLQNKLAEATNRHFGPKGAGTELARQTRQAEIDRKFNTPDQLQKDADYRDYRAGIKKAKVVAKKNKGVAEGSGDLKSELAAVYSKLAPKIERHRDSFGAGQLYDALEAVADKHGAGKQLAIMMRSARNSAHMEYDTNPGGFENWFWFLPFATDDEQNVAESNQSEYDDEVGMIKNDIHTLVRCSVELYKLLEKNENVAEWVQEKIAVAKSMMVTVLDYVASEHEMGNVPHQNSASESVGEAIGDHVHHNHVGTLRATSPVMDEEMPAGHEPIGYAERVAELEAQGLTTSDAQGVADAEVQTGKYKLWRQKGVKHTHVGTLRSTSTSMEGSNPSALTKFRQGSAERQAKHDKIEADRKKAPAGSGMKSAIDRLEKHVNAKEGWTHDSLAAQLFEQELTYEDQLQGMLTKKLKK
jgi:hypothetical protein